MCLALLRRGFALLAFTLLLFGPRAARAADGEGGAEKTLSPYFAIVGSPGTELEFAL